MQKDRKEEHKLKQKLIKGEDRKQSRTDNTDKYEKVINVLQDHLNTQKTFHKTYPVWWMMECNKIMAEQKRAYHRYIQNMSAESYTKGFFINNDSAPKN
jgi:hypothetical protein